MRRFSFIIGVLFLGVSNFAVSSLITYGFTGEVDFVRDATNLLDGQGIATGSTFSGRFSYDTSENPKFLARDYANYRAGGLVATLNDTFSYEAVPVGDFPSIQTYDNNPTFGDGFNYGASDGPGPLGQNTITRFDTSFGLDQFVLQLVLLNSDTSLFSDLALPSVLRLSDFDSTWFMISASSSADSTNFYRIRGRLTSLGVVPLPATTWLLIAGIAGVVVTRRAAFAAKDPAADQGGAL